MSELQDLRDGMRAFTSERQWERFHDPKSLLLALVGEVGELAERFQWLPAGEAAELVRAEPLRTQVGDELADVLLYLVRLADVLDISLAEVAIAKMAMNQAKHPVEGANGPID
jgi:dCTP diphosphatase